MQERDWVSQREVRVSSGSELEGGEIRDHGRESVKKWVGRVLGEVQPSPRALGIDFFSGLCSFVVG